LISQGIHHKSGAEDDPILGHDVPQQFSILDGYPFIFIHLEENPTLAFNVITNSQM